MEGVALPDVNIILGPPGTGKTENLLRIVDQELKSGTPPDRIAFVSFTTKATNEARDRAKVKFILDCKIYMHTLYEISLHITVTQVKLLLSYVK